MTPPSEGPEKKFDAGRSVASGVVWAVMMRWTIRFIGLFSTLVLARLLTPDDFGVAAMGMLVVYFLYEMSELGTSIHLIRAKEIDRAHCDTAWTITLLQAVLTAAALSALAIPASHYFKEPRVVDVMYVLALASLIEGFQNIGPVLLRRELQFAKDFRFNVYKKLLIFVTTITSAVVFRSYWALVFGHLAGTIAGTLLSYVVHPYRPRWSLAHGREYLRFSLAIIPLRLATTLRAMIGGVLVGGLGNTAALGSFRVAGDLATLFTKEIVTPMGRGLLPTYSRLADQPRELSAIYRRVLGLVALLCIPAGVLTAALAQDLTLVLLGPQWGMAARLIEIMAIGAAIYAVSQAMVNQILIATGREKSAALLAWLRLAITAPILWAGLHFGGVIGLAQASIVAALACLPVIYNETRQAVQLSLRTLAALLWRPIVAAAVAFVVVRLLPTNSIDWAVVRLALDLTAGIIVFLAAALLLWAAGGRPESAELVVLNLLRERAAALRRRLRR